MWIPKVWADKTNVEIEMRRAEQVYYSNNGYTGGTHTLCLDLGNIVIKQQGETVYIKGEKGNAILLDCNRHKEMRVVTPYSHLIPTWMKEDFNKFLEE